ncbi:flagellar motor switch phosphatase FliY [Anaeromicropila populeti]|uniref:Flagellar motor switch protein FliN/FliY n=1 Tax=Anaeromicropila populeti TaxID=37658 RepID=A0A1I6KXE7_9FIRM|nr:flagellar motor switch phosphatase FliY [Anaeromicropila populeti]SFR95885.1 flagellar motor switch protein FliN/FliY [Anaeromicropila populeti]
MDGMLSQEEINALLNGIDDSTSGNSIEDTPSQTLLDEEKDALGEISNISMGSAATTLSTLVNNKVIITTPVVSYSNMGRLSEDYDKPCVFIQISYKEGLDGNNVLILKESDVKIITDLMMGGNGINVEGTPLSELHLSAISEAMNQMMGSAATSLSSMLEKKVDISPPVASLIDLNDTISSEEMYSFLDNEFVVVKFKMEIENLVDSQIMQLYPFDFARDLYRKFSDETIVEEPVIPTTPTAPVAPPQADNTYTQGNQGIPQASQPAMFQSSPPPMQMPYMGMAPGMQGMGQTMPMGGNAMPYSMPGPDLNVQPAQFQPFSNAVHPMMQQENIGLIMDVPLEVTVELGRTSKSIKEILDFSPGTIIELDKLAGEPIDVLVNGKFVAKGEVVVIEESFGIRVTEIIK